MKKLLLLPISLFLFLSSCGDDDPVSNTVSTEVNVLSLNLYAGGDFSELNSVTTFNQLKNTAQKIWLDASINNGSTRFDAMSDMIIAKNPDIIMLTDVASWYEQSPGDFVDGVYTPNADDLVFDNLLSLQNGLGTSYEVVSRVETKDWEFPRQLGQQTNTTDMRIKLENIILAKSNITTLNTVASAKFVNNDNFMIEDYQLNLTNGYQIVELQKGNVPFTVINARLIGSDYSAKQSNQGAEILAAMPNNKPVIAALELNNIPDSDVVQDIIDGGFTDAWARLRGSAKGYTCCISSDLRDNSGLSQRTTYQFVSKGNVESRSIELIGDDTQEQTANPTNPYISNQYGLMAKYRVVVPN